MPSALVEWLTETFPDRVPLPTDTKREIFMAIGRQQVIRKLRKLLDESTQNVLENSS